MILGVQKRTVDPIEALLVEYSERFWQFQNIEHMSIGYTILFKYSTHEITLVKNLYQPSDQAPPKRKIDKWEKLYTVRLYGWRTGWVDWLMLHHISYCIERDTQGCRIDFVYGRVGN